MRKIIMLLAVVALMGMECATTNAKEPGVVNKVVLDEKDLPLDRSMPSGEIVQAQPFPGFKAFKDEGLTIISYDYNDLRDPVCYNGIAHFDYVGNLIHIFSTQRLINTRATLSIPSLNDGKTFHLTGIVIHVWGLFHGEEREVDITAYVGEMDPFEYSSTMLITSAKITLNETAYFIFDHEIAIGGGNLLLSLNFEVLGATSSMELVLTLPTFSAIGYYE